MEPLYCGQHWDKYKCPEYRGVLISGVNLYYKARFGTFVGVLNRGESSFQGVLNRGVSLYCIIYFVYNYTSYSLCNYTMVRSSVISVNYNYN